LLAKGRHLKHIVHFGDQQVFPGATNYVCLLFLSQAGVDACRFVRVDNLETWLQDFKGSEGIFPAEGIAAAGWNFTVGRGSAVIDRLRNGGKRLGDVASIFVGLQTSADRIYVLESLDKPRDGLVEVRSRDGLEWELETLFLRPFLSDLSLAPFQKPLFSHWLVFPYWIRDGESQLVQVSDIRTQCPQLWKYLKRNEGELRGRESGKVDGPEWYGYIYRKNLTLFERPKLIVQVIAQSPRFAFDDSNLYFTGGGNGPYYGVRWLAADESRSLHYLQAILNSPISDYFIRQVSTTFRGGYWSYGKRFIEQIPIVPSTSAQEVLIARLVNCLLWTNNYFKDHPMEKTERDPLMLGWWEQVLNGLIYELYFPDELHSRGLRLFELVAQQEKLPGLTVIAESERLSQLREGFEAVYATHHPLRGALHTLRSLETVRIIEGAL